MPDDATVDTRVADKEALRDVVGEPIPIVVDKEMPKLDKYCRQFIEMSPFLCLGTAGADGHIDMSPRGDPAGFVKILDDTTLLLPERQGNQRVDSMQNLMDNPNIGLIFFLPGVEETLRIRGRASITRFQESTARRVLFCENWISPMRTFPRAAFPETAAQRRAAFNASSNRPSLMRHIVSSCNASLSSPMSPRRTCSTPSACDQRFKCNNAVA